MRLTLDHATQNQSAADDRCSPGAATPGLAIGHQSLCLLHFSQPITAFGADWFETTGADDLTVSGNFDGTGTQTVNFLDYLGVSGNGFLGIIGSAPFSSITFGTQGAGLPGSIETFGADNLAFASGSTTPIPTPALLPGLIGMGIAAWRKRKGEQSEPVAETAEV